MALTITQTHITSDRVEQIAWNDGTGRWFTTFSGIAYYDADEAVDIMLYAEVVEADGPHDYLSAEQLEELAEYWSERIDQALDTVELELQRGRLESYSDEDGAA